MLLVYRHGSCKTFHCEVVFPALSVYAMCDPYYLLLAITLFSSMVAVATDHNIVIK